MELRISQEELPKTLFEVSEFFKLEKVSHFLFNDYTYNGLSEISILNKGGLLLDLENENSKLRKWFIEECFIKDKHYILVFINEYIKRLTTDNDVDFNDFLNIFQNILCQYDPDYKLQLRREKINKIKNEFRYK